MTSPPGMRWAFLGSQDMLEYGAMKSLMGSDLSFFGTEPALGVFRQDLQTRLGRWLVNQHGPFGEVLVITRGRSLILSRVPVWASGQNL